MEKFVRFLYQNGAVHRVEHGGLQIKMAEGETYVLKKLGHSIRLVNENGQLALIRFGETGDEIYRMFLRSEGLFKLGPGYGYRVKSPSEENDPILKIAREIGIPVSKVEKNVRAVPVVTGDGGINDYPTERHAFCGAVVSGGVIRLNDMGFVVETLTRPIHGGKTKGVFVNRLVTGVNASPPVIRKTLSLLGLTHSPEWDIGGAHLANVAKQAAAPAAAGTH